ncbi:MTH938/NDUFAF3 family protein [Candidatus Persebacteraceae bacterium Df01]|jgi:uncharacterized protein|uniref:MTH938/NDUFAF3 family protein n=1 Tax=Candidatus Doriopsillibacter californiensis TaxID=2970740 RepID=A0ABT7QME8_9GAMM|nr:MTH938/NDUFAF3 family protein [Candidatus Persebacteraceae bacterium Df01]
MKIQPNETPLTHAINACGDNFVVIDGVSYKNSLLLTPNGIVNADLPNNIELLSESHLQNAICLSGAVELFLLGGCTQSTSMRREWLIPFAKQGMALEVMSLSAACRTYQVLHGDGRAAAAILII